MPGLRCYNPSIPISKWIYDTFGRNPERWGVLRIASSTIGLLCYALSSSFKQLYGEWDLLKLILYVLVSIIISYIVLFPEKFQVCKIPGLEAHVVILVLMLTSLCSISYNKEVNGERDALSVISNAAITLTAVCLSKPIGHRYKVGVSAFFVGCLMIQLTKINSILTGVGVVYSYIVFALHDALDLPIDPVYKCRRVVELLEEHERRHEVDSGEDLEEDERPLPPERGRLEMDPEDERPFLPERGRPKDGIGVAWQHKESIEAGQPGSSEARHQESTDPVAETSVRRQLIAENKTATEAEQQESKEAEQQIEPQESTEGGQPESTVPMANQKRLYKGSIEINEHPEPVDILNWRLALPEDCFNNLTELVANKCVFISNHVIPSHVLTSLIKLNRLKVSDCDLVEVIFDLEGINVDTSPAIPLSSLELINLPKLKYVWTKDPLRIDCFQSLRDVTVRECESLRYIFPASVAKGLTGLHRLEIVSSGVEVIVAEDQTLLSTIHFVFPWLRKLVLKKLANLKNFYPRRHKIECQELWDFRIEQCKKVMAFNWEVPEITEKKAADGVEIQYPFLSTKVVPELTSLYLNQNDFRQICNVQFQDELFQYVECLYLDSCDDDKLIVFLCTFLENFSNVYRLTIGHSSFKEIFSCQQPSSDPSRKVPPITFLTLTHLDRLQSIWNEDCQVCPFLQNLRGLDVNHCPKLIKLAPFSASWNNLTELKVSNCNGLKYLLSAATTRSLVKLRTLKIKDCKIMEEIVTGEHLLSAATTRSLVKLKTLKAKDCKIIRKIVTSEDEDVEDIIVLKSLEDVELVDLPVLRRFCSQTYPFKFPLLKKLTVTGCPKMKTFCTGVLDTPLLKSVIAEEKKRHWEGNLDNTLQQLFLRKCSLETNEHPEPVDILDWRLALPEDSFNNLTALVVNKCVFISNCVIPSCVLTSLFKLLTLTVSDCDSVEVIFDLEGINVDTLPAIPLSELKLINLPKLKYVWNKDPLGIDCFQSLTDVTVGECESLRYIFPASVAKCLTELRRLEIVSSGVEIIVAEDQTPLSTIDFVFPWLDNLILIKLANLKNFYPRRLAIEHPGLRIFRIEQCKKVTAFNWEVPKIPEKEADDGVEIQYPFLSTKVIPRLSHLYLNQNDFRQICNVKFQDQLLQTVFYLCLDSCDDDELFIFPYAFLENFPRLQGLIISHSSFKEIFSCQQPSSDSSGEVPFIVSLTLTHLDQLQSIWNEDCQIYPFLQNLKILDVNHCSKLIKLAPSFASFNKLKELKVSNCDGLKYLLSAATTRSLVKLRTLKIQDCKIMKEIVRSEDEDVEDKIALESLEDVELVDLPVLRCFCSQTYAFEFPSLKKVTVTGCPKMETFCEGVLHAPKLGFVITENNKHWEGNLNNTIQKLFSK